MQCKCNCLGFRCRELKYSRCGRMYQPGMKNINLLGMDQTELIQLAEKLGEKPFRGKQLYHQIYCRKEFDTESMTDLAKAFRLRLSTEFAVSLPRVSDKAHSEDGTIKFLLKLEDGAHIESVYIPESSRDTLCISSQVGCDVGCTFCMTAQMGFKRNLTAGEILGQVLRVIHDGHLEQNGFNIVFMGMGEPLYNYKNVMKAFRIMTDSEGMNLSYRGITLSTSGVVPVLRRMANEERLPNLAISLNATTSEIRNRVMPINRKWDLEELLEVCREFPIEPRRRITIEYVLLQGETDSDEDACRLAQLLRGIPAKVNLIPYNPNPGLPHRRPDRDQVDRFQEILDSKNIPNFVRKTRGDDVAAACGQLAHLKEHALVD